MGLMRNLVLALGLLASVPAWAQDGAGEEEEPATDAEEPAAEEEEPATDAEEPAAEEEASEDSDTEEVSHENSEDGTRNTGEPTGPEDILLPYVERDAEAEAVAQAEAHASLIEYCTKAKTVVIGKVLTSRVEPGFPDELVELLVETTLRGEASGVITARVPRATAAVGEGFIPPSVIEGYRLLVFLDPSGTLVEGNALFFLEAELAFRNKRPDNFLRPRSDRDWIDNIDPSADYIIYQLDEILKALDENPMRRNGSRRRFCRWFGER
jgi:hypothetical protein